MRNSIIVGVLLGLLLVAGAAFGVYFYLNAPVRPHSGEIADISFEDDPVRPQTPVVTPLDFQPRPQPGVEAPTEASPEISPEGVVDKTPEAESGTPDAAPKAEYGPPVPARIGKTAALEELERKIKAGVKGVDVEGLSGLILPDAGEQVKFEAVVSGKVVDSFNLPVAGAEVFMDNSAMVDRGSVRMITTSVNFGCGRPSAVTNERGEFSINVERMIAAEAVVTVSLSAGAKDHAASEVLKREVKQGEHVQDLTLKLRSPGSVRGVVSTVGGHVEGAKVSLRAAGGNRFSFGDGLEAMWFDPVEDVEVVDYDVATGRGRFNSVVTDQFGVFNIQSLPEGEYEIFVEARGYRCSWLDQRENGKIRRPRVKVKAGEAASPDMELLMTRTASLRATLQDANGAGIRGAARARLVHREGPRAGQLARMLHGSCNEHGLVVFDEAPAGDFDVIFMARGWKQSATLRVNLTSAATCEAGVVVLEAGAKSDSWPDDDATSEIILPPELEGAKIRGVKLVEPSDKR